MNNAIYSAKSKFFFEGTPDVLRLDYGLMSDSVKCGVVEFAASKHSYAEKQVKFDLSFLNIAKIWSLNSHAKRRKVGCIIVRDYNIISDGYNGTPSGFDNACEDEDGKTKWSVLHAEANAITKLAKSNQTAQGATLYITFSPCRDCAKLILQAGISRVVYTNQYSDTAGLELLAASGVMISRYFPKDITVSHGE